MPQRRAPKSKSVGRVSAAVASSRSSARKRSRRPLNTLLAVASGEPATYTLGMISRALNAPSSRLRLLARFERAPKPRRNFPIATQRETFAHALRLRDGSAQLRLLIVERIAFQRGLRVLRDLAEGWQDVFQILWHCGRQPRELLRDVRDGAHILRAFNVVRGQFDERVCGCPILPERSRDINYCLLRDFTIFFPSSIKAPSKPKSGSQMSSS